MKMNHVEQLDIFKRAHLVALEIYKITAGFPKDELYGLSSQMKRAAVSINSNLMEGGGRNTFGEYKHFIGIARGSLSELKYQTILAKDLEMVSHDTADRLVDEMEQIGRMMTGLLNKLATSD
ncbi:MAG: four helix bundle protein [Rickettsiales bacterium]|jgi:four helix bundle protein|nr:four helix bundle protein [Rickettsiales bacterium]